ncbi:MAG: amidohydrolase family protein, partial [Bacilli bacterium]
MNDLLITNGNLYIDGKWKKANIGVKDERIAYLGLDEPDALEIFNADGLKIIPGLIDPHVHFSLNCGTVVSVDDFASGTRSAVYGGVTTIVDFVDPARNAKTLEKLFYERLQLAKTSQVDYHLHGCIKEPDGDLEEFVLKMKSLGMNTIKLFTTYSETHRRTYDKDIYNLLKLSKKYNFLVVCHIENDDLIKHDNSYLCTDIAKARPSECEKTEALKLAEFVKQTGGYLYMVHCSSGDTLQALIDNYSDILGQHFFVESCPQYFLFNESNLQDQNGYLFTFAPPLRSANEQELLVKNISYINTIGTDHCSFNVADKKNHPSLSGHPLGIGGIETSFLVLHKMFGDQIIDKMSKNVAKLEHFSHKGSIEVGK